MCILCSRDVLFWDGFTADLKKLQLPQTQLDHPRLITIGFSPFPCVARGHDCGVWVRLWCLSPCHAVRVGLGRSAHPRQVPHRRFKTNYLGAIFFWIALKRWEIAVVPGARWSDSLCSSNPWKSIWATPWSSCWRWRAVGEALADCWTDDLPNQNMGYDKFNWSSESKKKQLNENKIFRSNFHFLRFMKHHLM